MRPLLRIPVSIVFLLILSFIISCTTMLKQSSTASPKRLTIRSTGESYPAETIIDTRNGQPITFDALLSALAEVQVVYIGETHTDREHHLAQARLVEALHGERPDLSVGMEMFDHRHDPVLALWSAGELDEQAFIEKSHWYARCAGWGYDFDLYAPLFETVKSHGIRLVGLNMPFWISSEIRAGGLASLLPDDRRLVAADVDTGNAAHRAYLESVFQQDAHRHIPSFEFFYEAQCAWEDTMAESIARKLGDTPMVVIIGNGHIQHKYGVPDRAYARQSAPFRTIYLASAGLEADLDLADFIWVTK